jgi:hypothetical protein
VNGFEQSGTKVEAGMLSFSPAFSEFVGTSKESVLLSKNSLSASYTTSFMAPPSDSLS